MSSVGLITGFFLKHLDSVLKSIASATEVVLTMVASAIIFGVALDARALIAAGLVGAGVALYNRPIGSRAGYEPLHATPPGEEQEVQLQQLHRDGGEGSASSSTGTAPPGSCAGLVRSSA